MTNPHDDLMALADRLRELVFRQGQIDWDALIKIEIDLRLAASRPATQVVDREPVASLRKALQLIANRAMAAHASDDSELDVLIDIETFARQALKDTHPPKSPDISAAVLQSHALKQALDCLSEIAAAHIPDCPAHYAGDELSWVQRHVGSLRLKAEIARDGIAAAIRQLPTSKLVNPEKMYSYNSEAKVEFEK